VFTIWTLIMIADNSVISQDSKYSEWLEKLKENDDIKHFDHSEFENVKKIGRGGYGTVYYANYRGTEIVFKKPIDEDIKTFVNEPKCRPTISQILYHLDELSEVAFEVIMNNTAKYNK
ncbi:28669_t:CDS:2, partial [Dentiscutata erythropus]